MTTTNQAIRQLEPQPVWNHFADLNAIPRASKQEEQVIAFARTFGESLGLSTKVDDVGNVVIQKPASPGMEDRIPVVLQSHLDMVHQKNADSDFNFATQGIQMYVDGDWVKAQGTTLGADNGMGVASIMTVLASDKIAHPPLEALFTIDEETGMTGAQGLKPGALQGKILLNLDTEEDNELTIGCAGGCDVSAGGAYEPEPYSLPNLKGIRLTVRGLTGGHSGVDIHLGRGNANKIMTRLLWAITQNCDARLASIDGGGLRNAIPRESVAVLAVTEDSLQQVQNIVESIRIEVRTEYATTDPEFELVDEAAEPPPSVVPQSLQRDILATLYACPCGIHRMSPDIEDLVQTSNNLARVLVRDGEYSILCLTRSSVDTERDDLAVAIQATLGLSGGTQVEITGAYPGWQPAPHSKIVEPDVGQRITRKCLTRVHLMSRLVMLAWNVESLVDIISDMEMISFGPTIRGAHSPDERVNIRSVQKFWKFLLTTLERIT